MESFWVSGGLKNSGFGECAVSMKSIVKVIKGQRKTFAKTEQSLEFEVLYSPMGVTWKTKLISR